MFKCLEGFAACGQETGREGGGGGGGGWLSGREHGDVVLCALCFVCVMVRM